jgi:hypothetical protein
MHDASWAVRVLLVIIKSAFAALLTMEKRVLFLPYIKNTKVINLIGLVFPISE